MRYRKCDLRGKMKKSKCFFKKEKEVEKNIVKSKAKGKGREGGRKEEERTDPRKKKVQIKLGNCNKGNRKLKLQNLFLK